ncbi:hypothetical protein PT240_27060, partial [Klebsiella pneumoniae]|nr:hypothetical protein [Klebsiella pneumoniae]
ILTRSASVNFLSLETPSISRMFFAACVLLMLFSSAVKNAKKHGIDIVCVGYGIDKPLGFDGVYFKKINDISELNSLYKDLIRSLV